jgi:sialate O-acetylesterase
MGSPAKSARPRLIRRGLSAFLTLAFSGESLPADVKMPAIFGDHMVLQQDGRIPVWGTADPGENVEVSLGATTAKGFADAQGHWRVDLPAQPGNALGQTLTVTGKNLLVFQDVLVGDVWLASGGSNMALTLGQVIGKNPGNNDATANATNPALRLFIVRDQTGLFPQTSLEGAWEVSSPETAATFSAVGYFFGSELLRALNRPVGLICASWMNTPIQSWLSFESLQTLPFESDAVAALKKQRDAFTPLATDPPPVPAATPVPTAPVLPDPPPGPIADANEATALFNGKISPLIPYALKGVVWYQGEKNADARGGAGDDGYGALLAAMVRDWRARWGAAHLPFLIVGLANYGPRYPMPTDSGWARVREAQEQVTETLPNTALTETLGLGDLASPFPSDKLDVGKRLAAEAEHIVYGQNVPAAGPSYAGMTVEGSSVRIKFQNVGTGLAIGMSPDLTAGNHPASTTELTGFTMAAADKRWVYAQATIDGNDVVVSSDQITIPAAVRYGWAQNPDGNLSNKDGFPAVPFRTDDWPYVPPPPRLRTAGQ